MTEYRTAVYELVKERRQNHSSEQAAVHYQEWPSGFENKPSETSKTDK